MKLDYSILDDSEKIILSLRALYQQSGFVRYRMDKFEEYDLYAQNKDFLISENVITFTDTDGKLMALKPDVTLSVIKNLPDDPVSLRKISYNENVYRVSRGTGSFREIMQTGLECLGDVDSAALSEVLLLAAKSMELCASSFVLELSHLDILLKLLNNTLTGEEPRRAALKCIGDKNPSGVLSVCREAGAAPAETEALAELVRLYGPAERVMPPLKQLCTGKGLDAELCQLEEMLSNLGENGYGERVQLDFSSVSNLNYYNGILFKGFVDGLPESVLSGGQYDKLMRKMGRKSKAVGFAVYLDRLERMGGSINSGVVFRNA